MVRSAVLAVLGVLAGAGSLTAQASTTQVTVFSQLSGDWQGQGSLMGRDAEFRMQWQVESGFAVLRFSNAFAGPDGTTPVLTAVATYRTTPSRPEAVWLDSRGVRIEIRWEATDSTLTAHWQAPDERGRTVYRVTSDQTAEVHDEVETPNGWRRFATARYRRTQP